MEVLETSNRLMRSQDITELVYPSLYRIKVEIKLFDL